MERKGDTRPGDSEAHRPGGRAAAATAIKAPETLLCSRAGRVNGSTVDIGGVKLGGRDVVVIAGPCSVESGEQMLRIAWAAKSAGAAVLRGGAYKPRTSPYDFQGLGETGLRFLKEAARETGLKTVTEVIDPRDVEVVAEHADCLQIGSRNMQNFCLLREVGRMGKPVLLKRGMAATYRELLMAAEYVMAEGNERVILCERGIRALSDEMRFTLDLSAVPYLKEKTHLPVIVDPSHGTGNAGLVPAMSRAAVACGADGIMVETHHSPEESISDAAQTISTVQLAAMVRDLAAVAEAIGRRISWHCAI